MNPNIGRLFQGAPFNDSPETRILKHFTRPSHMKQTSGVRLRQFLKGFVSVTNGVGVLKKNFLQAPDKVHTAVGELTALTLGQIIKERLILLKIQILRLILSQVILDKQIGWIGVERKNVIVSAWTVSGFCFQNKYVFHQIVSLG